MDTIFKQMEDKMDPKEYDKLIASLEANAEEIRREAIKPIWENKKDDSQIQELINVLGLDLGFD